MRCKYCGSKLVYPETQHKTFSTGKAIAGAVTVGVVGAAAGFIGKDKKGYKCGECGAFMEIPMDFMTESSINNAVKKAEEGGDRSLYDYFKGQYPNIQANILTSPMVSGDASVIVSANQLISDSSLENDLEKNQASNVKRRYSYEKWEPDAPIYIESVIIEKSDSGDLLLADITNQTKKTIRSAYFQVTVYDDTGDIVNEKECVYQGMNVEPGEKFPVKNFELETEIAYRVALICQKASFIDDSVWRRDSEIQSFVLNVQPKMTEDVFPRLKYVRNMLKDYSTLDREAELFLPHEADGFWQCICGHPVKKDALCPRCQASYVKLQELLSQKNLEAKQQREVKAIASARAEKTIRLYEEAVNYCKAEEERREAEKKEKEEARIKAEEARIVAEKREAEERERRRIQEEKELALRKAKQKRYLKIAGICVGVFVILTVGITSYNKYTIKNKYEAGIALMEQGEYENAIEKFQPISGYNDADKLLKECTDQKNLADAKQAEENNDADEAEQYYNQLNDEIVNASKYEYIISHKDSSDTITERYINDLWERQYESEKIAVLINEIYPITVNMVFNKTEDDESTNLESVIIKNSTDYIYFHMIVEGGLAQHEYRLKLAMSTDLKKDIHTQQFSGSLPADLTDFIEKLDTNSMAIWGFSRIDYVEMELVDQDSDEVLKTAKMKLTYQ